MKFFAISEKGKRENNEDAYLAEKIGSYYAFAVADGLGGHAAGEIASRIAILELRETVRRKAGSMREILEYAYEKANEEILFQSEMFPERKGMGTTLTACILDENGKGVIANVGDSRAYVINDEIWHTRDHSYVQELVDKGVISEEEAMKHPMKNIVTRVLGVEEQVTPDFYEIDLKEKTLLLSTDGLHDYVREERIVEIARAYDPERACKELVREALREGSEDNITVVVMRCEEYE